MHADYTLKRLVQVRFVCLGWFSSGGRDGGVQGGGGGWWRGWFNSDIKVEIVIVYFLYQPEEPITVLCFFV